MMSRLFLIILLARMFCLAYGTELQWKIEDTLVGLLHNPIYSRKRMPPSVNGTPLVVTLELTIMEIRDLDEVKGSFEADIQFSVAW